MKSSKPRETHAARLFVAGVPSAVSPDEVADFFSHVSPALVLEVPDDVSLREKQRKKGFSFLTSYDPDTTMYMINTRYFRFLNRTLTVMQQLDGVNLIIQNKRIKKCKFILKNVPATIAESQLKSYLQDNYGKLDTFYKLSGNNPYKEELDTEKRYHLFHTYSGYFREKSSADALIKLGTFQFLDGSRISVHKNEVKKRSNNLADFKETARRGPESNIKVPRKKVENRQCSTDSRPLDHLAKRFHGQERIYSRTVVNHSIRPCNAAYFREQDTAGNVVDRTQEELANYRFNLVSRPNWR